jgi:hypothetical protein
VEQEFIDAVRWLERKGVSGITGSLASRCRWWKLWETLEDPVVLWWFSERLNGSLLMFI